MSTIFIISMIKNEETSVNSGKTSKKHSKYMRFGKSMSLPPIVNRKVLLIVQWGCYHIIKGAGVVGT